jgi:hypothetical protein
MGTGMCMREGGAMAAARANGPIHHKMLNQQRAGRRAHLDNAGVVQQDSKLVGHAAPGTGLSAMQVKYVGLLAGVQLHQADAPAALQVPLCAHSQHVPSVPFKSVRDNCRGYDVVSSFCQRHKNENQGGMAATVSL